MLGLGLLLAAEAVETIEEIERERIRRHAEIERKALNNLDRVEYPTLLDACEAYFDAWCDSF